MKKLYISIIIITSTLLTFAFFIVLLNKNNVLYNKDNKDTLSIKDSINIKNDTLNITKVDTTKLSKPKKIQVKHYASWYRTEGTRVHRNHPTAAYNHAPKGTKLRVINCLNGDTTIVEVTDRMGKKSRNHIDLSHRAFGEISKHGYGIIPVMIEILD